jgi:hypothetical protein
MAQFAQTWLKRVRALLPVNGYAFSRPLLLLQSDDWGRVGLCDVDALEQMRSAGFALGERPYDLYSLESAEDLAALARTLKGHRDRIGRMACITMNFVMANLDFTKMAADGFQRVHLRPLCDGVPDGWHRPGLLESYREGVEAGVFWPALHGETHFCRFAVERELENAGERADLLRTLWRVGIPYIHWRMPWVGYEYWDPEQPSKQRFVDAGEQNRVIGSAVGHFARFFSALPRSACAPGYRANEDTHRAWQQYGVRIAQNGPGTGRPPHMGPFDILHLYRTLDFEPALENELSIEEKVQAVSDCFANGRPAIVSIHAINFQSSIHDFRSRTLDLLDQFLSAVEAKHPDLLYAQDGDVYDLVQSGCYVHEATKVPVTVSRRSFSRH